MLMSQLTFSVFPNVVLDVKLFDMKCYVDIMAVVSSVSEMREVNLPEGGVKSVRVVTLKDNTGESMQLMMWGAIATSLVEVGSAVLLRRVLVNKNRDGANQLALMYKTRGDNQEIHAITRLTSENAMTENMMALVSEAENLVSTQSQVKDHEPSH